MLICTAPRPNIELLELGDIVSKPVRNLSLGERILGRIVIGNGTGQLGVTPLRAIGFVLAAGLGMIVM